MGHTVAMVLVGIVVVVIVIMDGTRSTPEHGSAASTLISVLVVGNLRLDL